MTKQNNAPEETAQPATEGLIGQVPAKQIQDWKKQHEKIFSYEAEGRICYLKKASRKIVSAATTLATSKDGFLDATTFLDVLIENSWLGGDETLRTEDKYLIGLSNKVNAIVEVVTGELKEL